MTQEFAVLVLSNEPAATVVREIRDMRRFSAHRSGRHEMTICVVVVEELDVTGVDFDNSVVQVVGVAPLTAIGRAFARSLPVTSRA
ncbi:hypothetical protein WS57_11170 [Burkholderia pseudomultivorans]|nr:hypothetical protein WS57_11170 [Burkholderia pseudomultivorans]